MSNGRFINWNKTEFTYTIDGVVYHCTTRSKGIDLSEPDYERVVTRVIGLSILDIPHSLVECSVPVHEGSKEELYKEQEKGIQTLHRCIITYSKRTETDSVANLLYSKLSESRSKATEWLVACLHSIMRIGDNTAISTLYSMAKTTYGNSMPDDMYKHMTSVWSESSKLGRTTLPPNVKTHLYTKAIACMFVTLKENYSILEPKILMVVRHSGSVIQPVSASVKRHHNDVLGAVSLANKELSKTLQLYHVSKEGIQYSISKLKFQSGAEKVSTTELVIVKEEDEKLKQFGKDMSPVIAALDPTDETRAALYQVEKDAFIKDMHKILNNFLTSERIPEAQAVNRIQSISLLGSKDNKALILIEMSHGLRTDNRTYPFMQKLTVTARSQLGKLSGAMCKTLLTLMLSDEADKYVNRLGEFYGEEIPVESDTPIEVSKPKASTNKVRKDKRAIVLGEETVRLLNGKMHEKMYNLVHNKLPIITLEKETVYTIYETEGAVN